jgi:thiamine-phosphate pyrophosphorylase
VRSSVRQACDLSVYFVTDPVLCAPLGVVGTALAAVQGGATLVQLRDPQAKGAVLLKTARALVAALAPHGVPLIVNDRPDVALLAGAAGVHLGQDDLPPAQVRAMLGPDALIGLSVTDPQQLGSLDWNAIDHLGAGPVYTTGTKSDAAPALGLEALSAICAASRRPVVAIGGIDLSRTPACIRAGAQGVAVVSAIASAPDPQAAARALVGAVREARG